MSVPSLSLNSSLSLSLPNSPSMVDHVLTEKRWWPFEGRCAQEMAVTFAYWSRLAHGFCAEDGWRMRCVGGWCSAAPNTISCVWNTKFWTCAARMQEGYDLGNFFITCCESCNSQSCYIEYEIEGPSTLSMVFQTIFVVVVFILYCLVLMAGGKTNCWFGSGGSRSHSSVAFG